MYKVSDYFFFFFHLPLISSHGVDEILKLNSWTYSFVR